VTVVDEQDAMPDKHIVFDGHTVADECVALNSAATADRDAALNLDESSDACLISYRAAVEVREVVNDHIAA
jgi:hypothetical protein